MVFFLERLMMRTKSLETEQKHFFTKIYENLRLLEQTIKSIKESMRNFEVSVFGKLDYTHWNDRGPFVNNEKTLKLYWKKLLGASEGFGILFNP